MPTDRLRAPMLADRFARWRRHLGILLLAGLTAVSGPVCAWSEGQPINAGNETGFPPYSDADAAGRSTGFAVELLSAVAEKAEIPIRFTSGRWSVVWNGLIAGKYDALPLVARMREREGLVELTSPHTIGYDAFFVRSGDTPIKTIEQARNLNVIVLDADAAHHALLGRGFDRQMIRVDSLADGFRLLASGQHDALLAPILQGNMVLRKTALAAEIKAGPLLSEYRREFCFAVPKGEILLRDRLDRGLALVKASGDYDRLYRKWLGIYEPAILPVRYVVAGVAAIAAVIALMVLWTWTLRRRVRQRTAELVDANATVQAERRRLRELNAELEQRVAERTAEAVGSEMRFRAMADAAPVYIWLAGADKKCTWFNKQWLDFTGCSLQHELDFGWAQGVHPDDVDRCLRTYGESFDRREPFEMEYRLRRADGEYRWLLDRGVPHIGPNGDFLGYVGTCVDISERRQMETDLKLAKAEAERANAAKSRFLAAASHDLRQPLSALALYVGVLGSRIGAEETQLVTSMRDCVSSLSEMLSDLLNLSKLEAGAVKPSIVDFPLGEMLDRIIANYGPKALAKGIFLRCVPCSFVVRSDVVLFSRVVGNLVANAVRYTHAGGVLVGCRRRGGKLWIEVWDTGVGIPADKTGTVFEEFTQLRTGDSADGGSGLGLAIVSRTARVLGLEIRVASRVGKGSMFAVELPLGEALPLQSAAPVPHRPLRIALVDDSAAVRTALVYALHDAGHQVVAAATRKELMSRLDGLPPDIVISDYRLAGRKTGFDAVSAVRQAFDADLPALIITGDTDPKVLRRMAGKGVRVQHKPIDLDVLHANIAELTPRTAVRTQAGDIDC